METRFVETTPAESNLRAAFNLGFFPQYRGTDFLDDAWKILAPRMNGVALSDFRRTLERIDQWIEMHESNERNRVRTSRDVRSTRPFSPPHDLVENLRFDADRCLKPADPLRVWYDIGKYLGKLHLVWIHDKRFPDANANEIGQLQVSLRRVTKGDSGIVPSLSTLAADRKGNAILFANRLHTVLSSVPRNEWSTYISNPDESTIVAFAGLLMQQLGKFSIEEVPAASSNEARDAFIYSERLEGTLNKQIVAGLRRHPEWKLITSYSHIRTVANAYAELKELKKPDERRPGRPPKK